ncbi:hypothetical protein ACFQ40_01760 [Kroppenstedtia eburnea]|uniref:hypothetical protein n=1 Tax=Kroppenstedtia eburnea TaxID=714067 RepID=UPI00362E0296
MNEEERREDKKDLDFDPVQFAYEQSGELTDIALEVADRLRKPEAPRRDRKHR